MKQMEMVRAAWRAATCGLICLLLTMGLWTSDVSAQGVTTTTVQGTVYLANGRPGSGTLTVRWPAFTTATGQAVAANSLSVTIPTTGFVSVNLAPNQGSLPAGQYYTAVYYLSDGSTSTEYWVVPAAATATLAQVRSMVMPAAQAVQAVSKAYVDQAVSQVAQSMLTTAGGTLSGPLILNGDPTVPLQAADKHYVDVQTGKMVPLAGGNMTGALNSPTVNGVQSPATGSAQTTLQAAVTAAGTGGAVVIPPTYTGTDTFTNPNGVRVNDLRTSVSQQSERSVKEFGAACDGVTDDTNALQSALNYANAHGVALTIPEGTCKTRTLSWRGESIGGMGKQVSALMGYPGQDVLASTADSLSILSHTRLHDLTIYVDQSVDVSCAAAAGRAAAGTCQIRRLLERNSIFSPGGNGLTGTAGTGAGWSVGNCAIAMPASTGAGGNGLKVAEIENLEIATTGTDPMTAQYAGSRSTHTCGMYLAQWPQWSEFRNIDIRGVNTGIAIPALPGTTPSGLNADSNRWQNVTVQAVHGFTSGAGSNNVVDNFVALAGNAAAMAEPPTGLVLDFAGTQQGWTVRNAVVLPSWTALQPALVVTAAGGAVTAVSIGAEHGLGWDPYGVSVPVAFSGSCTAQATAAVNSNGSIGSVTVTQGGVGCSSTTTASVNAAGTWNTAAAVNVISGQNQSFFAGNLLKGSGGYTVWNAAGSKSFGTQLNGGGGNLPGGGTYAGLVGSGPVGSARDVDQYPGADFGAKLQACVNSLSNSYGGTCDARNFTGSVSMSSNVTVSTSNATVLMPCATITTANQIVVAAGTRNVSLRGCALRGGTAASGSAGGTAIAYSGASAAVQVGDTTYAVDTPGFHLDNAVINTTAASTATAQGIAIYRVQELDLESLYLLGNANQTGMTLDGTGNYTGGTILDVQVSGFQTGINAIGHQTANAATTDWLNASTFVRPHIVCPTSGGNPITGTYGINLQQGDGNTFTGGDVEGCATALHLGANAQNNTVVGLRNENSTQQVVADTGSQYNSWITAGTMFTGKLTDNGTHNSFWDSFHRGFNGLTGDLYRSQTDATITNHYYLGTGQGHVRGLQDEYFTDIPGTPGSYQATWEWGPQDGNSGQQVWALQDMLNNVPRIGVQETTAGGGSPQTYLNSAGGGSVCFNCSTNSGTGGVGFSSGGASPTTVATISNAGNAQFNGTLQVNGTTQSAGTITARNNANAEVDYFLWPGLTTSQKGSFTYKDWNGASQWYMVKDASNNWALNSAIGGLDSFKAYQSTNSGDTYINASNTTGHIRLNYESGSGSETDIYAGTSTNLVAAFLGPTAIKMPGLAASSGHSCLQIDNSGYITNTGSACGVASSSIGGGSTGQIAYYIGNGAALGGLNTVPVTAGGTGAASAAAALTNLGGASQAGLAAETARAQTAEAAALPANGCSSSSGGNIACPGGMSAGITNGVQSVGPGATTAQIQAAITAAGNGGEVDLTPGSTYTITSALTIPNLLDNGFILDGKGATIVCNTAPCVQAGDNPHDASYNSLGIVLRNLKLKPTANSVNGVAILNNALGTRVENLRPITASDPSTMTWLHLIQNSNLANNSDTSLYVDHLVMSSCVLRHDSSAVGDVVYQPYPFPTYFGIVAVDNSDISLAGCGNGLTLLSGNTNHVKNTVIQGFQQWAVKYQGNNWQYPMLIDNMYCERGATTNPQGIGGACLIANGGGVVVKGGTWVAYPPTFTPNGTTGSTTYQYYAQAVSSIGGISTPLPIGIVTNGNTTVDSYNNISGSFNRIPGADSYKLLRVKQDGSGLVTAPHGTGSYLVAMISDASCGTYMCTFIDSTTALSSALISGSPSFAPTFNQWIDGVVLGANDTSGATYFNVARYGGTAHIVPFTNVAGSGADNVSYTDGVAGWSGYQWPMSSQAESWVTPMNIQDYVQSGVHLFWLNWNHIGNSPTVSSGRKGWVNLGGTSIYNPEDLITLIDSDPDKTAATQNHRPTADAYDAAIYAESAGSTIGLRAQTSIKFSINQAPGGTPSCTVTSTGVSCTAFTSTSVSCGAGTPYMKYNGACDAGPTYTLPAATASVLGGVKGASGSLTCTTGYVLNGFQPDGTLNCVAISAGTTLIQNPCGPVVSYNGGSTIPAGTYTYKLLCLNTSGVTNTINSIKAYSDNNGSSTCNAADSSANALLTGAVTATTTGAAGTQSATTTITNGSWINWTVVSDGASTVIRCAATMTRAN